jgi:hypothetical protein
MHPYTYKTRFLFTHPSMDFTATRDMLTGIEGIHTARISTAGQERYMHTGQKLEGKYHDCRWGFDFETGEEWNKSEEKSATEFIEEMLAKLESYKSHFNELAAEGCELQLIISVYVDRNVSEGFTPAFMKKLADFDLELWIDMYDRNEPESTEKYEQWIPIDGLENEMWVEEVRDDQSGLRVILKKNTPSGKALSLTFKNYFLYRNVDESYRLTLWGRKKFDPQAWPFFTVSPSALIEWLHDESGDVYTKEEMVHYIIKTGADVIEIVGRKDVPPRVEWIDIPDREVPSEPAPNGLKLIKKSKRGTYYDKE